MKRHSRRCSFRVTATVKRSFDHAWIAPFDRFRTWQPLGVIQ
jgi:hypothetical protein